MKSGSKMGIAIALGIFSVTIIASAIYLNVPQPQAGGVYLSFYSAQSKPPGYVVYATLTNNSTSAVALQKVYFDGLERTYSTQFLESVGGVWSLKVGDPPTNTLGAGATGTLMITSVEGNSSYTHTIRVVTNASTLEFNVEPKVSSLAFRNYTAYEGPGIDYLLARVDNIGTATGNIVQVAIDGIDFEYVYNMQPPSSKHQWSVVVEGNPSPYVGIGKSAQIYVNNTDICHTCTHIMKVSCIDGSTVEFVFKIR